MLNTRPNMRAMARGWRLDELPAVCAFVDENVIRPALAIEVEYLIARQRGTIAAHEAMKAELGPKAGFLNEPLALENLRLLREFRKFAQEAVGHCFLDPVSLERRWGGLVSQRTLRLWRANHSGPSWTKIGRRVVYPIDAVRRWETERAGQWLEGIAESIGDTA